MSTTKSTVTAAALLLLLLSVATWQAAGHASLRKQMAENSRFLAAHRTAHTGNTAERSQASSSSSPRHASDDVPPHPLTGEALVRAYLRDLGNALYDPGYTFSSIQSQWATLPEAEWPRLLREVDEAPFGAA